MDRNLAPFEGGSGTSMGVAGGAERVEGEPCFSRSAAAVSSVAAATAGAAGSSTVMDLVLARKSSVRAPSRFVSQARTLELTHGGFHASPHAAALRAHHGTQGCYI